MFSQSYVPLDEDLADFTCIELTSNSEWNLKTVSMKRNRPRGGWDSTYDRHAKEIERENRDVNACASKVKAVLYYEQCQDQL